MFASRSKAVITNSNDFLGLISKTNICNDHLYDFKRGCGQNFENFDEIYREELDEDFHWAPTLVSEYWGLLVRREARNIVDKV